jgi:2-polyprenyl-6-methoxyphenol hydroxylase-like FAD-dependent oxidoreductase
MPTDVLVLGAGPVGLAMAAELARYGLTVRIIDKNAVRTDKSKALVVWSRTLELLDRTSIGAELLAAGRICKAANLMSGPTALAHITFEDVDSTHPYALMIPQSETERVLEDHLRTLGVAVERNTELTAFTQSADSVTCTLSTGETVTADYLVACDGAHSIARHILNFSFEGDTLPSNWMLADVHLHGLPNPEEMHIFLHEAGVLAMFPIGAASDANPRTRIIANTGSTQSDQPIPEPTLAEVQAVLDQRGIGAGKVIASDPIWLANFTINERKISNYRSGRVFLAGDAAHIHSPAGGQGMNTGIQDACNLAWKLALVQRKLCAAAELLLESYSAERGPVAEQVIKSTGKLTSLATMQNSALLALRNTAVKLAFGTPAAKHAMANELTEISVHYPDSPLNDTGSKGERLSLQPNDAPIGAGDTPRFALFAAPGADAEQFIDCFPNHLEPTPRPVLKPGTITLVRPDGYVAFRGDTNDYPKADAYMTNIIYGEKQAVTLPK